jgi:hypothetical protein
VFLPWEIPRMFGVMRKMRSLNLSKVDDNYLADYFGYTIRLESLMPLVL